MSNEKRLAFLATQFEFNPIIIAVGIASWLTGNGNRKVAYTFFTVEEDYNITSLDNDLAELFGLRRRKQGGVIFYASDNPIAQLSKLLYNDETKLRVRWI